MQCLFNFYLQVLCAIIFLGNIDFQPYEEDVSTLKDEEGKVLKLAT